MHPSIFTDSQWMVMMFWYAVLITLGGGFLMLHIVSSGYRHMASSLNQGIRVSFIDDVQRAVLAVATIALAPIIYNILSGINDGFVYLFGSLVNHFADNPQIDKPVLSSAVGMFENILAAPFKTIINIFITIFGLHDLDHLIFNGNTKILGGIMSSINTGNPIGDVILNGALVVFTIYFNAVYTIRRWVLTANLVATPVIAWVWATTNERQIYEIWISEVIQSVFMQTTHALSLGIFVSILAFTGNVAGGYEGAAWLANGFIKLGIYFAGFAGAISVYIIITLGTKLIFVKDEKTRSEVLGNMVKTISGLGILGLSVVIASFLAYLLSGDWGTKDYVSTGVANSKITVWEIFFMLLTVIPVSKMFATIFMKMVVRVGTVNQERWALFGLGALGMTYSMMRRGGMLKAAPGLSGGSSSGVSGLSGGPGGGNSGSGPGNAPTPGGSNGPSGGVPGSGGINMGAANLNNAVPNSNPGGYRQTPSGLYVPPGAYSGSGATNAGNSRSGFYASGTGAGMNTGQNNGQGNIPERGKRNLEDIINIAHNTGSKVGKASAVGGIASSIVAPEAAPVMAAMYGAAGKAVGGMSSTAYNISREIKDRKNNGQDFWGAMQGITGTSNRMAATTKVATTMVMSPMGKRASTFALNKLIK